MERYSASASGYGSAVLISVALHVVLLVVVAWGWESAPPKQTQVVPRYVEAKLVEIKPKAEKPAPKKKTVNMAEKRRQQAIRDKQRADREKQKQRAVAEQKRKRTEELARQKKLAAEKAAKEKAAAEAARQQQLAEQRALEQQQLAEQQRIAQEAAFAEALAEEEAMLQAETQAQQAQSYIGLIAAMIEQNWSRPPSARKGMVCELSIQLIPTGEVIHVAVVKSSGNAAFDRSAEQAVKKAGRFEVLRDVPADVFDRYFRQLRLKFNPQDLRL
ncbi:cell envelope integrity protein TolA [Candidatus Pelagadaptatus aseana]|uniref:cell envelope integrity protein TolA n=1 Tax=Candidatus Pelagadaptatus aseana TaxID=3120508 RepID=UPI003C701E23